MMTKEQRKIYQKEYRKVNKHKLKEYREKPAYKYAEANRHLVRTYGITIKDKQAMWDSQNGLCSVCDKTLPDILDRDCQVEHCHSTNKVRSLAHWYCNIIVGVMENHPVLLSNVVNYLDKHKDDAIVRTQENNNLESVAEMSTPI